MSERDKDEAVAGFLAAAERLRSTHAPRPKAPPLEITDEVLERARERGPKRNREPRPDLPRR